MKAKAPEKIYLEKIYLNHGVLPNGINFNETPNDIEYTRTDAFIEKACEWLREFNNHHEIIRYSDSCEPPLSELAEWFKNYLKEK